MSNSKIDLVHKITGQPAVLMVSGLNGPSLQTSEMLAKNRFLFMKVNYEELSSYKSQNRFEEELFDFILESIKE